MADIAIKAGADAIGVVLAKGSPRSVSFETARSIEREFGDAVAVVAVVAGGCDWPELLQKWRGPVQVHGEEAADRFRRPGVAVIRGIAWSYAAALAWDAESSVAALLVDGPRGGSGLAFDHGELSAVRASLTKPLILAGGLTPDSVGGVIERLHPYGVDVSSGVELAPGEKDPGAIRSFCQAARAIR